MNWNIVAFVALNLALAPLLLTAAEAQPQEGHCDDQYLWLEDVTGQKALDWVGQRNQESMAELAESQDFLNTRTRLQAIFDSDDRIAYVDKIGPYYYNFWKDSKNPKGLWRRTTLESYKTESPQWEILLDLDALGAAEKEGWVWQGASILKEGGYRHALLSLSRGGADASVIREFDIETRTFVVDGFNLPEAKGDASWLNKDALLVATDFGPGTMTTSGYPRIVKLWKRGTPLEKAVTVFEGQPTDMIVGAYVDDTKGFERTFIFKMPSFYTRETFLYAADGALKKIQLPDDATMAVWREWLLVRPRTPWTVGTQTFPAGSLVATDFRAFLDGKQEMTLLFSPEQNQSLRAFSATKRFLILNVIEDVQNRLTVLTPAPGKWIPAPMTGVPEFSTLAVRPIDHEESDDYWMDVTGFLTPTSLYMGSVGKQPALLKQTPPLYNAQNLEVSQHFVASKDGTRIPYFQVSKKGMPLDGSTPTLLYGYGGFEISLMPSYNPGVGAAWLEKGGAYVVANIRGGGEYGPAWHQAALKANRMRAYEDFAAVATDLVERKVTSVPHLGMQGGSNGGLLMGNMLTHFPHLAAAIVCQVPLLDMKRYSKLLAGASWMAEYGDPDKPEEWEFIKSFSAYHNVKADTKYPPTLFMTSTRDDRVHPGHARKMMAKMKDMGHDVRYYENIEGGHGGAADNKQRAHMWALAFQFLWQKLNPASPTQN